MKQTIFAAISFITILFLVACGSLNQETPLATLVPTIELATAVPTTETVEPTETAVPPTATATTAPAPTQASSAPPASQEPTALIHDVTNVREGPGLAYAVSYVLGADTTAPILGRNQAGDWWAVPGPGDGPGPVGWIFGGVVSVQGDFSSVPILIAPPLPPDIPVIENPGAPPTNVCLANRPGQFPPPDIHLGPGRQFAVVAQLGNWAEVLKTEIGWHQILLGPGEVGWVDGNDVDLTGPCVAQDPIPVRIEFAPGETSITLDSNLEPPQREFYVFRAFAGQRVIMEMVSESNRGNFAVSGVADGQPYKRLEDEQPSWSIVLPTTQDYLLTVAAPADAPTTGYRLTLTIEPLEE